MYMQLEVIGKLQDYLVYLLKRLKLLCLHFLVRWLHLRVWLYGFVSWLECIRMIGSGSAAYGQGWEMDAIAACVLGGTSMAGGKGRISGTVFGAMVIGIISNGLNLIGVSSYWQLIIKGLIIACAVLLDVQKDKLALLKNRIKASN